MVIVLKSIPLSNVLHLLQIHLIAVFQIHWTDRSLRQSKMALDAVSRQPQEMTNRMAFPFPMFLVLSVTAVYSMVNFNRT